jgi:hypothetical protein
MKQTFNALAAALFIAAPALAGAQTPPSQSPSPSPSPSPAPAPATPAPMQSEGRSARAETAKGELVKVDADAKKITIKGADGMETDYAYTDTTDVAGGSGVAGLATKAGTRVTVHFKSEAGTKTATKIEVDEKK